MVSEDINETMNYSIMSTRSVITHTHTHTRLDICPLFQERQGWLSGGGGARKGDWAKHDKSADHLLN